MKERKGKGPFGLTMVGGIVDTVVQGARRRAQDREPRALVYDASGLPRGVPHDAPEREALIATAGELIDLVGAAGREAAEAEAEAEAEAAVDEAAEPADARAVSAVEPDPGEAVSDAEVVTDAEVVDTGDDVLTADDEVTTAGEAVADADVVEADDPAGPPPGDRP